MKYRKVSFWAKSLHIKTDSRAIFIEETNHLLQMQLELVQEMPRKQQARLVKQLSRYLVAINHFKVTKIIAQVCPGLPLAQVYKQKTASLMLVVPI